MTGQVNQDRTPPPPPPISSRSGSATGALGRVTSWPRRKQRNKKYVILKAERYTSDIENVPCKTYLFLFCKVPLTKRERNYRPRMLSRFCLDHLFIVLSQQGKFEIAHENTSHYKAMHLLYIEIYDIDQRMRLWVLENLSLWFSVSKTIFLPIFRSRFKQR